MSPHPRCAKDTVGVEVNGAQDYVWTDIGAIVTDDLAFDTVGVVTEFDVTLEVLGTDIWGCSNVDYLDITVTDSLSAHSVGSGNGVRGRRDDLRGAGNSTAPCWNGSQRRVARAMCRWSWRRCPGSFR